MLLDERKDAISHGLHDAFLFGYRFQSFKAQIVPPVTRRLDRRAREQDSAAADQQGEQADQTAAPCGTLICVCFSLAGSHPASLSDTGYADLSLAIPYVGLPVSQISVQRTDYGRSAAAHAAHAARRSVLFNGKRRTRLPVAAKIAFRTAGAATAMVGSPTPPQKPPRNKSKNTSFPLARIFHE